MTEKDITRRDIGITFDFIKYLIENPSKIKRIPNGTEITFLEETFPELERKDRTVSKKKIFAYQVNKTFESVAK
ncbi:MAG: hypothetical protein AUJ85_07800 [Elusimicrobia bacterium CG1_02_37_114]|nr:MAG: hypothetical protein AUJ85_07800 [Elusimicrobia bacterium CG1_02_37_114]PIV53517.1 MAG: hypothetical protein COS17_03490 [Elusimicrobia bacterium CG02_land_8_20_14_3_00_37_13]PIZ13419.1 MAG: hypothetical protein COY53_04930 [Elusimicrobia bacterium CG_4_10_14_0_8_um_filter_37_32]